MTHGTTRKPVQQAAFSAVESLEKRSLFAGSAFQFEIPAYSAWEDAKTFTVDVIRTGDSSAAATVRYAAQPETAKASTDYVLAAGTLSFKAGEARKSITVKLTDDKAPDGAKRFHVALVTPSKGNALGTQTAADITILDNDGEGFAVSGTSLTSGGDSGNVTVAIKGKEFTSGTAVSLVNGSAEIAASDIDFRGGSLLYATFDLAGKTDGTYALRLSDSTRSTMTANAFHIVPGRVGEISMRVIAPGTLQYGMPSIVTVEYTNTGNIDAPAPLMSVGASAGRLRLPDQGIYTPAVQLLGVSPDGPGGILRPGQTGRLPLAYTPAGMLGRATFTATTLTDESQAMDWASLKENSRPTTTDPAAWEAVWENFVAAAGPTLASYHQLLAADANYLSQVGVYSADIGRLTAFEFEKANSAVAGYTIAQAVDAAVPTPGLDLTFSRSLAQPITGRYRLGALGRGWTNNWEMSAASDTSGNVTIRIGNATRRFRRIGRAYVGVTGDSGKVTVTSAGEISVTETDGTVTSFHADGRLNFVQEPHGNRITAQYAGDRLATLTHSNGAVLSFNYNAQGRISLVTDPSGRSTRYDYDAMGEHLLAVTTVDGTVSYSYVTGQGAAREHALASITGADGLRTSLSYDPTGRLIREENSNAASAVTYTYGVNGGVTITNAVGAVTTYLLNEFGQPGQIRDPLGGVTFLTYDAAQQLTRVVGPDDSSNTFAYNANGNLTRQIDALGQRTDYAYDARGNLVSIKDAKGNTTRYQYSVKNDLLKITYPNSAAESFAYDPLGNLTQSTNRRKHTIGYTYDARGLVTSKSFADGSHESYTYDTHGNMLTAQDETGTTRLSYDAADRMTEVRYSNGRFLAFSYDSAGRRVRSVDQDGYAINYAYDAQGRLSSLTDGQGAMIVRYVYDAAHRLARKDLANGTFTTYEYDAADQLTRLVNHAPNGLENSSFSYGYDRAGRQTSVTTAEGTTQYAYDAVGQLTSAQLPGGRSIAYSYDAVGNRTLATENGVKTAYTSNTLNQYLAAGGTKFTYDADGNLIGKATGTARETFAYDDENRLLSANGSTGEWSYEYDVFGARSATTHNGVRTEYLIDPAGFGNVVGEYGGAGSPIAHYAHGLGLVSRAGADGTHAFYDFDATGSTVGLTGGSGTYVNKYSYRPFGQTTVLAEGIANPFKFVGEFGVRDEGSGMLHMRAREYDPVAGRFNSDDPLGLGGGDVNLRRYTANNPINAIDPSGTIEISPNPHPLALNVAFVGLQHLERVAIKEIMSLRHSRDYRDRKVVRSLVKLIRASRDVRVAVKSLYPMAHSLPGTLPVAQVSKLRMTGGLRVAANVLATAEIASLIPKAIPVAYATGVDFANSKIVQGIVNNVSNAVVNGIVTSQKTVKAVTNLILPPPPPPPSAPPPAAPTWNSWLSTYAPATYDPYAPYLSNLYTWIGTSCPAPAPADPGMLC